MPDARYIDSTTAVPEVTYTWTIYQIYPSGVIFHHRYLLHLLLQAAKNLGRSFFLAIHRATMPCVYYIKTMLRRFRCVQIFPKQQTTCYCSIVWLVHYKVVVRQHSVITKDYQFFWHRRTRIDKSSALACRWHFRYINRMLVRQKIWRSFPGAGNDDGHPLDSQLPSEKITVRLRSAVAPEGLRAGEKLGVWKGSRG